MSDSDAEWDAEVLISSCLPPSLRASCRVRSDCTAAAGCMLGAAAGSMSPSGVYGEVDWLSAFRRSTAIDLRRRVLPNRLA
mmetsp:Transcript_66517/g.107959  ORF Transcript_66517/g.107959 Transcript_66517/m.107959 type:complete len:81 (+) Transcript_66517:343-585(+)